MSRHQLNFTTPSAVGRVTELVTELKCVETQLNLTTAQATNYDKLSLTSSCAVGSGLHFFLVYFLKKVSSGSSFKSPSYTCTSPLKKKIQKVSDGSSRRDTALAKRNMKRGTTMHEAK